MKEMRGVYTEILDQTFTSESRLVITPEARTALHSHVTVCGLYVVKLHQSTEEPDQVWGPFKPELVHPMRFAL